LTSMLLLQLLFKATIDIYSWNRAETLLRLVLPLNDQV
jgi:hypothetical protein